MRFRTDRKWGGAGLLTTALMLGVALVINGGYGMVFTARAEEETPQPGAVSSKALLLDMQIGEASEEEVITTGARYVIRPQERAIACFQRIPKEREQALSLKSGDARC